MSLWTSLLTGSSGINAYGDAIGVVGDNIANVSTTGFKASRAGFSDLLGGTASNGQREGAGVLMNGPETMFGQGSLQNTGRSLDLAVRGHGFFVLSGAHDGMEGTYYSRDGRFGFDTEGNIVNPEGLKVQGYSIDPQTGAVGTTAGGLKVMPQGSPKATTKASMFANLDATATPPGAWNPTNPTGTSNYSSSMTVYDSLGAAHRVDVYFTAQGSGAWQWHAMVDGGDLTGGATGTPTEIASGTLTFTTSGALDTETTTVSSANFVGAQPGQSISFDFGDSITTDGGTGLTGSTQFASASDVKGLTQDGFATGSLVDLAISDDGTVRAQYSNGQATSVGRLALATFANEDGLTRAGGQLFSQTLDSGDALVGAAATSGRGAIAAGSLEGSNVDIASELVQLIAYQRAFQANARTVTTADEMLNETANLKR